MKILLKSTDTQATLVAASELNKCAYELAFFGAIPGSQIVHRPEITYVATGLYDAGMNLVSRTTIDVAQVTQVVEDTISYFKQDEVPFRWCIHPSTRPLKLDKALEHYGFIHDYDELMVMADLTLLQSEGDSLLQVKQCLSHEDSADFSFVQGMLADTQAYHTLWSCMTRIDWSTQHMLEFYVGYHENEPIAAGIVCIYGGLAGIYAVGVIPEEQHKGHVQDFMNSIFSCLVRRGIRVAVTTVVDTSESWYKNNLFKPLCVSQVWGMHEYRQQHEYV